MIIYNLSFSNYVFFLKSLGNILILFSFVTVNTSCQSTNSKDRIISEKNDCYNNKLSNLKETYLYTEVMRAFQDAFPVLQEKKENFGVPEVVEIQIDDAIFFKRDSSECMLIVLKRFKSLDLVFGQARMVRGSLKNNQWNFDISMDFSFSKDYFQLFKENSFRNISKLARYNVLTEGKIKKKGCEIDDYFWFTHLKN